MIGNARAVSHRSGLSAANLILTPLIQSLMLGPGSLGFDLPNKRFIFTLRTQSELIKKGLVFHRDLLLVFACSKVVCLYFYDF